MNGSKAFCDGIQRRDLLRVGAAGLFGTGFSLAGLLAAQERAAAEPARPAADKRNVSLLIVYLKGGLSTIDTFDLKPDAPAEFRGEFSPISSNVAGIQVGEHLPRLARQMDKFSLLRSFGHRNSNHGEADHYMLTGYHPVAGFNPSIKPNNQRPSHGSIVARKLGPRGSVPAYVCVPRMHESGGAAYLGPAAEPFVIEADPAAPDFAVPDIVPPLVIEADRVASRRELLARVDRFQRGEEAKANRRAATVGVFRRRAFDLMTSPEAKRAFDIQAEPDALRDEYGRHTLGQSCLMARRLVEAGVRCVTVEHSNWDTHDNNFATLKKELLPYLDSALSTLFRDLAERGLLETTLVMVSGEFGRTPRINANAGRDHWGPSFTVALGGGGLKGGMVVGKSDARAEKPAEDPYGPEDLSATMYHLLGINPQDEFHTPEGRPIKLANDGRLIHELM
ncbi:MAG TPA: DUF1501 domain-containing protein [Pirellulales bacterium]|nr:DUF1501 domain-containing protein [Pirellulales bacterium]